MAVVRRHRVVLGIISLVIFIWYLRRPAGPRPSRDLDPDWLSSVPEAEYGYGRGRSEDDLDSIPSSIKWSAHAFFPRSQSDRHHLPTGDADPIPRIQHTFNVSRAEHIELADMRAAVKQSFLRTWRGYKQHACSQEKCHDELRPVSGGFRDPFCGWAATLVDSLDTLLIMDEYDEFLSMQDILSSIDFTTSIRPDIPLFEATIRYLGGLIGAYDFGGRKHSLLLDKAVQLANVLMGSFDTPNGMPMTNYAWQPQANLGPHRARSTVVLSEVGSLSLEFTRLAQLTGNQSYYDAVARITQALDESQSRSTLPGMWPIFVDLSGCKKDDSAPNHCLPQSAIVPSSDMANETFTLAGKSDSVYEYLPKEHLLLGGHVKTYEKMYRHAMDVVRKKLLFRPMTKDNANILVSGSLTVNQSTLEQTFLPYQAHLTCYAGGQFALGARIFDLPEDLDIAERLTEGCVWGYQSTATGVMAEDFFMLPCESRGTENCQWDEQHWLRGIKERYDVNDGSIDTSIPEVRLPPGVTGIRRPMYILRPEAIESIFYLYRITGDSKWRDKGWQLFQAIEKATATPLGNSAIEDVTVTDSKKTDIMQSFWPAETLKYFYLLFSREDVLSLDDYILNTEAHPFRRSG